MSAPCPICGENLVRTSSVSDRYICPIDGTRVKVSATIEDTPEYNIMVQAHPDGHPLLDQVKSIRTEFAAGEVSTRVKEHIPNCVECQDFLNDRTILQQIGDIEQPEDATPPVELGGVGGFREVSPGRFVRGASIQKTAIWYMLKPRWIIRRKIQTAIRKKVRSQLHPLTFIKHN